MQVTTTNAASSTVVVKVSVHKRYAPSDVWEQLQAGRIKLLAEKLKDDLMSQQEGFDCTGLQDTCQLQLAGRLCSALVRVKASVLSQVLQVSGYTWLFVQPLGEEAEKYPVSWTPGGLPDSLKAAQERLKDTGALGLAIAERRIGYRATPVSLAEVRVKLGQKETVAWRLAGAPLHASNADAQAWITEMKFDAELLAHTRRVRKGTQDWLLRAETTKSPQIDVLSLEHGGKTFLITLSRLLPRQSPPQGVKQWRQGRAVARTRTPEPSGSSASERVPETPRPVLKPVAEPPKESEPDLKQMVLQMYQALQQAGLLGAPGKEDMPAQGVMKRPAEQQLQKEHADE